MNIKVAAFTVSEKSSNTEPKSAVTVLAGAYDFVLYHLHFLGQLYRPNFGPVFGQFTKLSTKLKSLHQ